MYFNLAYFFRLRDIPFLVVRSFTNFCHTFIVVFPKHQIYHQVLSTLWGSISTIFKNFVNNLPFQLFPFKRSSFLVQCQRLPTDLHEPRDHDLIFPCMNHEAASFVDQVITFVQPVFQNSNDELVES